jgi:hypothetical protein
LTNKTSASAELPRALIIYRLNVLEAHIQDFRHLFPSALDKLFPCESFLPPPGFGGVHLLSVIENHAHTGIRQRRTSTPRHHWHGGPPHVNKRRIFFLAAASHRVCVGLSLP